MWWVQELAGYDLRIFFPLGWQNINADYLSRYAEHRLEERGDRKPKTILKPENFKPGYHTIHLISSKQVCSIPPIQCKEEFRKEVPSSASQDEQYQTEWHSLETNPDTPDYITPSEYLTMENDILHYKNHLYIPWGLISTILECEHDSRIANHLGMDKTIELVRRNFWWPGMDKTSQNILSFAQIVRRTKPTTTNNIDSYHLSSYHTHHGNR